MRPLDRATRSFSRWRHSAKNSLCAQVDGFAERRRRHPFGPAMQQGRAEVGLELVNALAEPGLGDAETFGRLAETAAFHGGDKALQLTEVHRG